MIFITGHHNTGKTTLARWLTERGYVHVETSKVVRDFYEESGTVMPFGDWARKNNHEFDDRIAQRVREAHERAIREGGVGVVVTGNRQIEGIRRICDQISPLTEENLIVYVEADPNILFERQRQRLDRQVEGLTFERFQEDILGYDVQMGVERIREEAGLVIRNEGSLGEFVSSFETGLRECVYNLRLVEGQPAGLERRR